jgi:lipid-A-disaccharide synthase-like uncharacterized protein
VTRLWNRPSGSNDPSDHVDRQDSELRLIPNWSIALAILVFLAAQYLFHFVLPHNRHELMPMRLLMGYSWGTLFASYVLLVGYVSRDVRRRDMPAGLWMLIVTIMPGGVGAVVYFLLRQPVLMRCPNCITEIPSTYHFCPQCRFQVAPVCGQCFRSVKITDAFCTNCGHDLAADHAPARLRAYSD